MRRERKHERKENQAEYQEIKNRSSKLACDIYRVRSWSNAKPGFSQMEPTLEEDKFPFIILIGGVDV